MRGLVLVALCAAVGVLAGLVLSEVIGIVGYALARRPVGIRFLPLYLGAAGAVLVPSVAAAIRRR